ncbi:hypothetical protein Nepgr_027643 [Nepenthes gracilis]|uniref:Bifunctional inhibitor/plant lipid transfer protein/seed storage helical domain-containing protein n=1 Tax=Nepenthes gracilis TaxID=150966 RepID=A0AAD3Y356_NEPGR|nr:hypothetical protein Nepgr_027643 [Nepenthes gracilis]
MRNMQIAIAVAVMAAALWTGSTAQSSSSCTNVLIKLSPCLNYITGNSSTPASSCCTQLASVVKSDPQCLCQVISGSGSTLGISINKTQAMMLPSACNVQTPSVSRCSSSQPTESPAGSPSTSSSGSGSKSVPTPTTDESSGNLSKTTSFPLLIPLLFIGTEKRTHLSFLAADLQKFEAASAEALFIGKLLS